MHLPFPILTADEAAAMIKHDQTLGCSGFTPAGAVKSIPLAIASRAEAEHAAGREFALGLMTGASTGPSCDGALAKARALRMRTPYMSDSLLRQQINAGEVQFFDMHLSLLPQTRAVLTRLDPTADPADRVSHRPAPTRSRHRSRCPLPAWMLR